MREGEIFHLYHHVSIVEKVLAFLALSLSHALFIYLSIYKYIYEISVMISFRDLSHLIFLWRS